MANVQPPARRAGISRFRFLSVSLLEPRRPIRAVAVGWLLSLVGSLLLAAFSQAVAPNLANPQFPPLPPELLIFVLVVFAPLVETLIMAAVLELMLRIRIPPAPAVLLSALGWAVAHSLQAPAWGFVIWWPFLIFSTLYVTWSRRGVWTGVAVAASTHALQNLGPALLLVHS